MKFLLYLFLLALSGLLLGPVGVILFLLFCLIVVAVVYNSNPFFWESYRRLKELEDEDKDRK